MTKVVLVAGGQLEELPSDADVWVGVDRGSLHLIEQGIVPDLAVGDFDSVSSQEFELVQRKAKEVLRAQPEKMIQILSWLSQLLLSAIQTQMLLFLLLLEAVWIIL